MGKLYLGLSLGFNSSASLVSHGGGVICSISQERLNLEKNTKQLPIDAAIACCSMARKEPDDPVSVRLAFTHYEDLSIEYIEKNCPPKYQSDWKAVKHDIVTAYPESRTRGIERMFFRFVTRVLAAYKISVVDFTLATIPCAPLRVEHHEAHEWSCYPIYGKSDKRVVLTSDGFGDGYSGRIVVVNDDNPRGKMISQVSLVDSPALVYQFVTGAMGMKEHQHEGKVTGLAAHGKNSRKSELLKLLTGSERLHQPSDVPVSSDNGFDWYDSGYWVGLNNLNDLTLEEGNEAKFSPIIHFDRFLRLKKTVRRWVAEQLGPSYDKDKIVSWLTGEPLPEDMKLSPWDLALTVQELAEDATLNWLSVVPREYDGYDLYLAGGLFANVKLNQRIKDTGRWNNVFVSPPMGDEGGALGAAFKAMYEDNEVLKRELFEGCKPQLAISCAVDHSYDGAMKQAMKLAVADQEAGKIEIVGYETDGDVARDLAKMLANGEIVHWRHGRGEFGPRALGGSQSFYTGTDVDGTKTLNHALGRSEFMPYAPCVLEKNVDELFVGHETVKDSLRFMTCTLDVKPGVKEKYAGVVHVDGTSRPEVIYDDTPETNHVKALLEEYEKLTGLKMLVLTSYNRHGRNTVCLADDAYDTWQQSNYVGSCLVIDRTMFRKK